MNTLPVLFTERLEKIIPRQYLPQILKSFEQPRGIVVRVNTLKAEKNKIIYALKKLNISCREVPWYHDALILSLDNKRELTETAMVKNGMIFIQSLSSMLVPLVLDAKPGDQVLDMCAAPGAKATQIAAMMHNQGYLLALESVKERYFKLKSVINLLGANVIHPKLADACRFSRGINPFDRIIIDAQCSCEARFQSSNEKTTRYWSSIKIKQMAKKQKKLMLNGSRMLKMGGILVYSTCTFSPEENEMVIDWFLGKTNNTFRVMKIDSFPILAYPTVKEWNNKTFDEQVSYCMRILPAEDMEGFFIAKLMKTS